MTDAIVKEIAVVTPSLGGGGNAMISELAIVAVCSDVPPIAAEALISQFAFVTVGIEFSIPVILSPLSAGQFMQTMPYYIGQFN
jgi:hypothetical protein